MKVIKITKKIVENSYILFDASMLEVGDTVLSDVYIKRSSSYIIIINAGTPLTQQLYNLLKKQDNLYAVNNDDNVHILDDDEDDNVHVLDDDEDDNVHVLDDEDNIDVNDGDCNTLFMRVKHENENVLSTLQLLYDANSQLFNNFLKNKNNKIDLSCVESITKSIVFLIQNNKNYLKEIMPHLKNDYKLPIHSFNVTLYALHIGYLLHFSNEKLSKLGQAALLHDVGKKKICSIVSKNTTLTPKEIELTKEHSQYSVEILKENNINLASVVNAVKQHHERYDGSGYPNHLLQSEITDFASILAVCDVFDALTVDKPYRKGYATFDSLKIMLKNPDMKNKFNDTYIRLLLV